MQELLSQLDAHMQVRELSPRSRQAYAYHVRGFCTHFGKSASELGAREAERPRSTEWDDTACKFRVAASREAFRRKTSHRVA